MINKTAVHEFIFTTRPLIDFNEQDLRNIEMQSSILRGRVDSEEDPILKQILMVTAKKMEIDVECERALRN